MKVILNHLCVGLVVAAYAAALIGCETSPGGPAAVKTMDVNGARLPYVEEGSGEPVVFVHGAVSDHRTWDRQRAALARHGYRAVSYTQRYFGTEPWGQNWPAFGVKTHSEDLVAFIRGLGVGPVHLVAWSYSGNVALNAALSNPELIRSLFAFEPNVPGTIVDAAELKAFNDDRGAMFKPAVQAAQGGDNAAAVRAVIDGVGGRQGYFDAQPPAIKSVQLDNARTVPLAFKPAPPPPVSCAQLSQIKLRTAIVRGAEARPAYRIDADAAARCMPSARHIVVPDPGRNRHMWPSGDVESFNATLVGFLKGP